MDTRLERSLLNQEPERLNDAALRTLDSSLKKTSGFLKKVHALSDATCAALCAELPKLNLSKYVDEVAAAVAEAKLKLADVPAVLQFCSLMHRSYAAFAPALLPLLLKNVALAKPGGPSAEPDSERSGRLARKRVSLRVLFELRAIHVLQRTAPLLQCVKELIAEDLGTSEPQHPNQGVLTSFAKFLAADPLVISASARSKAAGGPAVVQAEARRRLARQRQAGKERAAVQLAMREHQAQQRTQHAVTVIQRAVRAVQRRRRQLQQ